MQGKASVLVKPYQLETWDVPIVDPEPGGALVSIVLGGVCGSDVHILTGEAGEMPFPIILGHEGIGRVEKLGAGVTTDYVGEPLKTGDLVYWSPIALCRRCYACTVLEETPCENTQFFEHAEKPNWGSYADYAWLPSGMPFFKLPDHANPEAVAALGCALPNVLVAAQAGAREIVVIDGAPIRLEAAKSLGATAIVPLSTPADERKRIIYDRVGRHGPDIVVEAAGVLQAFPEGVDLTGPHGRYIVLGLWGAIGTQAISPRDLTIKNLTIAGATFPKPKHYYGALHMAARLQDRYPLAELVSHRFGIAQAAQALELTKRGGAIKAVIDPTIT
jgi:5-exo-hydroxycamphor dehydrogenase